MELGTFIREAGVNSIRCALRREEEGILCDLRPQDIYLSQITYRMVCRMAISLGRMPAYIEMPSRLRRGKLRNCRTRLDNDEFYEMCERIETVIMDTAMPPIEPVEESQFPDTEADLERARRVDIYARQFDRIERRFGQMVDEVFKCGSKGREIWCDGVNGRQIFPSIRSAVKYVSAITGRSICRETIRGAIANHSDLCGMKFGYTGEQVQCKTGRERRVRCTTTGQEFDNLASAGRHFGYQDQRISRSIKKHEPIGDLWFEFVEENPVYAMAG